MYEISDTVINYMQIKVLLIVVRDFKTETGDPAYTMGIVDLLLECIELSYRPGRLLPLFPSRTLITIIYKKKSSFSTEFNKFIMASAEAGDIRLREGVRNAHGYQYLVQFFINYVVILHSILSLLAAL